MSGVPSDITSIVVAVLSRLVFDYAIWSRNEVQRPILLVCEEAHRYVPAEKNADGQAVRKVLERIAKEGRKYGVTLGLITQRPSDLAEGVLSQCGTIISMRLNNDRDQAFVKARCPKARAASSTSSRRCATANASSAARACRSRSASRSTTSSASAGRPRPTRIFTELWRRSGDEEGDRRPRRQALARPGPLRLSQTKLNCRIGLSLSKASHFAGCEVEPGSGFVRLGLSGGCTAAAYQPVCGGIGGRRQRLAPLAAVRTGAPAARRPACRAACRIRPRKASSSPPGQRDAVSEAERGRIRSALPPRCSS